MCSALFGQWAYDWSKTPMEASIYGSVDLPYNLTVGDTMTVGDSLAVGGDFTAVGAVSFDSSLSLGATKKLYLDGGGDTYLREVSTNNVELCVGGVSELILNQEAETLTLGNQNGLYINTQNYLYKFGDYDGLNNETFIEVDDSGEEITLTAGVISAIAGTSQLYLDGTDSWLFAPSNSVYIGDPEGDGSGTLIEVNDDQYSIDLSGNDVTVGTEGAQLLTNSNNMTIKTMFDYGTSAGLSLDADVSVYKLGDFDGEKNETCLSVDDDAETIDLNANSGINALVNNIGLRIDGDNSRYYLGDNEGENLGTYLLVDDDIGVITHSAVKNKLNGITNLGPVSNVTLTIAGTITVSKTNHKVAVNGGEDAGADTLINIQGTLDDGDLLTLRPAYSGGSNTVTVQDDVGNLRLSGDFVMDNINDRIQLEYDGTNYIELSRSDND